VINKKKGPGKKSIRGSQHLKLKKGKAFLNIHKKKKKRKKLNHHVEKEKKRWRVTLEINCKPTGSLLVGKQKKKKKKKGKGGGGP